MCILNLFQIVAMSSDSRMTDISCTVFTADAPTAIPVRFHLLYSLIFTYWVPWTGGQPTEGRHECKEGSVPIPYTGCLDGKDTPETLLAVVRHIT